MLPHRYLAERYGHLITAANKEQFLDGVDEDEALDLLRQDVAVAERAVLRLISVPLTQGQFDARWCRLLSNSAQGRFNASP